MAKGLALLFFLPLAILLVSGCTEETGKTVETTKLTIQEKPVQNQTPVQTNEDIEEARKEFEEFEKSQNQTETKPASQKQPELENQTLPLQKETLNQTKKCPSSCDDSNPCTNDFCSKETDYECRHQPIAPCCGNSECESQESYSTCPADCKKPECTIQCGTCETLDNESCSCIPKECLSGDGCCSDACNYSSDSDCPNPDKCASDSDCDDNNPCTKDACSGQPKNCSFSFVTECIPDGCCPENCSYESDSDCPRPSVVFSEIYYNPEGNDEHHEWIEVYNNGTIPLDFTKWKLEEGFTQHSIKNSTDTNTLNPDSYAVLAENPTQFLIDYPEFSGLLFDTVFNSSLSNTGEELILRMGKDGETADSLTYNSTWGGNRNGFSLEKINPDGPNTQENWNQSLSEKGTPGLKNSISP